MRAVHSRPASRWRAICRRGVVLSTVWCAFLAGSIVAADDDDAATRDPAIPPGEERLIATMLGRGTLVRDCTLVSGGIEYTVIKATYNCPGGPVALQLGHPLNATTPVTQTGQFAVTIESGSPPLGFEAALLSRIRSRQDDFVWTWPERPPGEVAGDEGAE